MAITPGGYSKNNMAIFTRAQSNPQFPTNLPNPHFQYKDLGQTLDSVYNNYLASRQDARQQGQLELQGRQDSRQQGLYDQQMQEAANKIQMQQNIERLRYGGTITGQNPDYGAEQINASLRPIPVQNANIPSMLVNPNLSRVPPPYQNPADISQQPDMTQVQVPGEDRYPQLRSGLMQDKVNADVMARAPAVKQQLELSRAESEMADARYKDFLRTQVPGGNAPQVQTFNGVEYLLTPGQKGAVKATILNPALNTEQAKAKEATASSAALAETSMPELGRLQELNKNTYGGAFGGAVFKGKSLLNMGQDDEKYKNTADVVNSLKAKVSEVLRSTFGAQLSDGERQYLNDIYGAAPNLSQAERDIAITNIKRMLQTKLVKNQTTQGYLSGGVGARSDAKQPVNKDPLGIF